MAVEREPVGLAELAAELGPRIGRAATLEAVEGLRRRSLLERTDRGPLFGLHSVVLEYVTEQLIEDVAQELASGELDRLLRQPLLKATAKEYVRRSQERLIAVPLVERLVERQRERPGGRAAAGRPAGRSSAGDQWQDQGYGPGNLVNLLRLLRGDLKGVDLSGLSIRQAYLQDVEAQGASLAGAHLSETVLGEAFIYPTSLALSADGAYLVAGTASGEVCWWRVADRTLLATLPGHVGDVWGMALSGDGRLVASGGVRRDGAALGERRAGGRWRPCTDTPAGSRRGAERGRPTGGQRRSYDGTVRLWEAEGGGLLAPPARAYRRGSTRVALSRDGRLVASGSLDGTVRLWEADERTAPLTLHGTRRRSRGVALSGDGRLVASGGLDGTVRLWEAAERTAAGASCTGTPAAVRGVALSGTAGWWPAAASTGRCGSGRPGAGDRWRPCTAMRAWSPAWR